MKKTILGIVLASILIIGLGVVSAASEAAPRDGTGADHDAIVAAGGLNGTGAMDGTGVGAEIKAQIKDGTYNAGEGKQLRIMAQDGTGNQNRIRLMIGDSEASTDLEVSSDGQKLNAKLSNGRNAEIKVMPNTASETALTRLRLNVCNETRNCTIELKQVGEGNEAKLAYELQIERHSRILGLFQAKMQVRAQVDAENGEVLKVGKPWWAFLATEPAEE